MNGALEGKILLATYGSENAATVARAAADLSARTGAELHVVHAWHDPAGIVPAPVPARLFEQDARRLLNKEVGRLTDGGAKVAGTHLVKKTTPWRRPRPPRIPFDV